MADLIGTEGNDTLDSGEASTHDIFRGHGGDDLLLSGFGADTFHTFGGAGLDRVTDFNRAEGDRVQLDPGDTYTAAQVGADTVITIGGQGQMILVGVALSSLVGDWIS